MSIFKIEEAKREGARLVVGLAGISGSGKTYTALQLAWGLANMDASKVGLICTENRRGRLYADVLRDADGVIHRFKVGDLVAPFSPARYIEAIKAFVDAGVEVLVIDSVSHEWEGIGGCHSIAEGDGNLKVKKWNVAKAEHKKFMNVLLSSPVHVIPCLRAKEKTEIKMVGGKTEYIPHGIQAICESNFTFELTASLMMHDSGKQREVLKCPAELQEIFGESGSWAEGHITAEHGRKLRAWVDGGAKVDPEIQAALDKLQMSADEGVEALQAAWLSVPKATRKKIGPDGCPEYLKASAKAFDDHKKLSDSGAGAVDDLNGELLNDISAD